LFFLERWKQDLSATNNFAQRTLKILTRSLHAQKNTCKLSETDNIDRPTASTALQLAESYAAGNHLSQSALPNKREKKVMSESEAARQTQTKVVASQDKNIISESQADATKKQTQHFSTRVIFRSNKPLARTAATVRGLSTDTVDCTQAAKSDLTIQPIQQSDIGDEWYLIQKILNHQKRGSRMFYQVLWNDDSRSWKPEKDISKYAIDAYCDSKNRGARTRKTKKRQ